MAARRASGSSPRVRGTGKFHQTNTPRLRFIPARAGNGKEAAAAVKQAAVHPRACGERGSVGLRPPIHAGSSPRVRGTVAILRRSPKRPTVHPRACGERGGRRCLGSWHPGSSPRVRGTDGAPNKDRCLARFIPARAGNGTSVVRSPAGPTVHPRACGERANASGDAVGDFGSSPRVRGTAHVRRHRPARHRFIPARAGNGCIHQVLKARDAVHPRACGERSSLVTLPRRVGGSSPRVRGTGPDCRQDWP